MDKANTLLQAATNTPVMGQILLSPDGVPLGTVAGTLGDLLVVDTGRASTLVAVAPGMTFETPGQHTRRVAQEHLFAMQRAVNAGILPASYHDDAVQAHRWAERKAEGQDLLRAHQATFVTEAPMIPVERGLNCLASSVDRATSTYGFHQTQRTATRGF